MNLKYKTLLKLFLIDLKKNFRKPYFFVKNFFYSTYVPRNEFHHSLDLDIEYYEHLTKDQREKYLADLMRRRNASHEKDLCSVKHLDQKMSLLK